MTDTGQKKAVSEVGLTSAPPEPGEKFRSGGEHRPRQPRPGIAGLTPDDLAAWVVAAGEPAYRAHQVCHWVWTGAAESFDEMRNVPGRLRSALAREFSASTLAGTSVRESERGRTEKALHLLRDGAAIESVLMRYPATTAGRARVTVCISSQVGCAVGCPFCATGELGFGRDLEPAEIVDQVRFWARRLTAVGAHVTNVVFMGMGEPLLNLGRVVAAAEALTDPARFGLGGRHITISTSGVVPGIERLTERRPPWTLAVSLHAARPALRDVLVPLNLRYPIRAVVEAATAYGEATRRRVSYEYVMISGTNDTETDADAVAELLAGRLVHVNLIPMNLVAHTPWRPSPPDRVAAFAARLQAAGIPTSVRRNRGEEIGAACGQLAAERFGRPAPPAVRRRRARIERAGAAALTGSG